VYVGPKKYYLYVPDQFYDYWVANQWNFSYTTSGFTLPYAMYFEDEAVVNETDARTHFNFADYAKQQPIISRSSCSCMNWIRSLYVYLFLAVCGDGISISQEQCDDKNTQAGTLIDMDIFYFVLLVISRRWLLVLPGGEWVELQ
jgi:hypothetical protein